MVQVAVLVPTVVQSLALEEGGGRGQVRAVAEVLWGVVVRGDRGQLDVGVRVSCGCSLRQGHS